MLEHVMANWIVMLDLLSNAKHFQAVVLTFAIGIVVIGLVIYFVKGEHRQAWHGIPLVIFILIIASAGGIAILRRAGISVVNLIFG